MLCGETLWDSRTVMLFVRLSPTSSSLCWWFSPTSVIMLVVTTKIFKGNFGMNSFKGIIASLWAPLQMLLKPFSEHAGSPSKASREHLLQNTTNKVKDALLRVVPWTPASLLSHFPFNSFLFPLYQRKTHFSAFWILLWCIPPVKKSRTPDKGLIQNLAVSVEKVNYPVDWVTNPFQFFAFSKLKKDLMEMVDH